MTTNGRPAAYILVESGLHAGAKLEIGAPDTWYAVGGSVDCEYWLADAALTDARIEFCLHNGLVVVRHDRGPDLLVADEPVAPGGQALVEHRLLWGGVSMRAAVLPAERAEPADAPPAAAAPPRLADAVQRLRAWTALRSRQLALGTLAVLAVVLPALLLASVAGDIIDTQDRMARRQEVLRTQETPETRLAAARAAAQRLSDLIGYQGISVMASDAHTLSIFGTDIPLDRKASVRAAVAQFTRDYGIRDNVLYRDDGPKPPQELAKLPEGVTLAEFGNDGYLRGKDGRIYLPGGLLPDGSRIESIADGLVRLQRGNDRMVLRAPLTTAPLVVPEATPPSTPPSAE